MLPQNKSTCPTCHKLFSTASNLRRHQRTAMYCINKKSNKEISNLKSYKCAVGLCDYITFRLSNFNRHIEKCKFRIENEKQNMIDVKLELEKTKIKNEILESQVYKLEQKNDDLMKEALKPKTIINNTINLQVNYSLQHLSPYHLLKEQMNNLLQQHYTESCFLGGVERFASLINEKILNYDKKMWMLSYTPNKDVFHRKDDEKINVDEQADALFSDLLLIVDPIALRHVDALNRRNVPYNHDEQDRIFDALCQFRDLKKKGSSKRKKCVKLIAEGNCVSKQRLILESRERENDDLSIIKITDELKNKYVDKMLSKYSEICEEIPNMMKTELTFDRCKRGISGLVEASVEVLRHDNKIWAVSFESNPRDIWIKNDSDEKIHKYSQLDGIMYNLSRSFMRHSHVVDDYMGKYTDDEKVVNSIKQTSRLICEVKYDFKQSKEIETEERKTFIDLLTKTICISDEELRIFANTLRFIATQVSNMRRNV